MALLLCITILSQASHMLIKILELDESDIIQIDSEIIILVTYNP